MKRMFAVCVPVALVAVVALLWSCSDDSGPTSFDVPSSSNKTQGTASGLSKSADGSEDVVNPNPHEEFNCTNVGEVFVRFNDPGFVNQNLVGLYVNYRGMPEGRKKLRIWWNYENDPTSWNDTEIGDGVDYEAVIEHAYEDITRETSFQVRAEVILVGKTGNCARNRIVTVTPGNKEITLRSPGAYPIAFSPEAGGGTNVTLTDDSTTGLVPLGFSFTFFGNIYSSINISSNGFLGFDPGMSQGCCSGRTIPSSDGIDNIIAFSWTDLYPPGGLSITYQTRGTAPNRRFVATFTSQPWCCNFTPRVTSQVILYEGTNYIEVHTTQQDSGHQYTQGVEDATGSAAYFLPGRVAADYSLTNDAVLFVTN